MQPEEPVRQELQFYYVGDHTWATMLGQSVKLQPVAIQSLSELERARLQEVALYHLEERELDCKISIPKETSPKAFGIPLSQVIANDRAYKQRQDALKESRRDCLDLEASVMHFRAEKRQQNGNRPLVSRASTSSDASSSLLEHQNKPLSPTFLDNSSRSHRRGGLSVDSISDLVESQSRLLEALQLSHPNELDIKKTPAGRTQTKLSLNPIYRQVPRVMERCCQHIHTYGMQTVGIFRVGSSKKRVRQLREDFDSGTDVVLDDEHSVHDVAALLKEFLRDMPDPLLPRELYCAFLHANSLWGTDQLTYLQHLLYLLSPCNCDTLLRLLSLLHTVQEHAHDSIGPDQQEIPGNKMTAANLAVIFGPNLLQKERGSDKDLKPEAMGIEDSAAIISVTLLLIQHYKYLLTVSAELQQEVLMSLIQTDPDVIDYLLRRKLSGSSVTVETDLGVRRDTQTSLDSVGQSSDDMSPIEPAAPSSLYRESAGGSSLSSKVFFNALCVTSSSKRPSDTPPKSIVKMRQFHSHHNLLSLSQPSTQLPNQNEKLELQESVGLSSSAKGLQFSHQPQEDTSQPQSLKERSVWVRHDSNTSSTSENSKQPGNFWDFFSGKVSGSETVV
ncbi:Rho GTPase-activating protein 6 [Bagarius yarrelli]|uniref:Rho GTPase-activating protein 6 n=1 Tax=Bagarius yarrelli TaxID=175774 RepID=A0A556TZ89_BAGYA|nr:Rho GTPase-activating protein 6 [Bagarius yarrelli]